MGLVKVLQTPRTNKEESGGIDSIASQEGHVFIITTNHRDALEGKIFLSNSYLEFTTQE